MTDPPFDVPARLGRARRAMAEVGVTGLLVTHLVNVRYLSGFTGSAGMLSLGPDDEPVLMTDGRYTTQAEEEVEPGTIVRIRGDDGYRPFVEEHCRVDRLGLEAERVSWSQQRQLAEWLPGAELVPTHDLVETARATKDAGELARLERAAAIGDETLARLLPTLRPGITERAIATRLDTLFRELGATGPSFEAIVASGPRGAMPHAHPTDEEVSEGDLLVLDFGCVVDGYCSDMTRTLVIGRPTPEQRSLYALVLDAQRAAADLVAPGIAAADLDAAARATIGAAGHEDHFTHGLGHGVGLEIHEAPWVRATSTDILASGHVITDEPGVYLPGFGGVRIEDMIVVTETGSRTLTRSPSELDAVIVQG